MLCGGGVVVRVGGSYGGAVRGGGGAVPQWSNSTRPLN